MGCLSNKSKIAPQQPGEILMNSGIVQFDKVYKKCEGPLKLLIDCRTELDIITTDFIKSLGAEKNWELRGDLKQIVNMMLVVLSANGNGNLDAIGVEYFSQSPFLQVKKENMNLLGRGAKKMMKNYTELIDYMKELPTRLTKIVSVLTKYADKAEGYTKVIADKTEDAEFTVKDKLDAIRNVNYNHRILSKAPEELTELLRITDQAKARVGEACDQAQVSPNSDLLITRGVQAYAEGLKKPRSVINRFWPIN